MSGREIVFSGNDVVIVIEVAKVVDEVQQLGCMSTLAEDNEQFNRRTLFVRRALSVRRGVMSGGLCSGCFSVLIPTTCGACLSARVHKVVTST
jgi:hypothetical protein